MSIWTTRKLDRDREYIVMRHPLRGVNNNINGVKFRDSYAVVEKDSKVYHYLKRMPVLRTAEEYPLTHLRKLHFITRTSDIKMVYGEDVYIRFLKCEEDAKKAEELAVKKAQEEAALAEEKRRLEQLEEARKVQERIKQIADNVKKEVKAEIDKKKPSKDELTVKVSVPEETIKEAKQEVEQLKKELQDKKSEITKCCHKTGQGKLCKFDALEYSPGGYCAMHLFQDPRLGEFGIELPKMMDRQEKKKARKAIKNKLKKLKSQGAF